MKVAILGCGPSGLLAAHAATIYGGHNVTIYSKKQPSHIHGAQYIHEAIPMLCNPTEPTMVSYAKLGDAEGYASKVYLDPKHPTSWDKFPTGDVPAWPMHGVYAMLWSKYAHLIQNRNIDTRWLGQLLGRPEHDSWGVARRGSSEYDLVLCSIPRNALCRHTLDSWSPVSGQYESAHEFKSASVMFEPKAQMPIDNCVIYNGRESEDWYRTSCLFGHGWTEYSASLFIGEQTPEGWTVGIKPTTTTCDCWSDPKLVRIGRFGRWQKQVLVTDAYKDTLAALDTQSALMEATR